MKLRLVKFLTSRENEIEKKEEGEERTAITCSIAPARPRPKPLLPLPLLPSLPAIVLFSLPPPSPSLPPPLQLSLRHGSGERCPPAISSPAIPLLPFFFIKFLKQQSVAGRTVAQCPASLPSCPT